MDAEMGDHSVIEQLTQLTQSPERGPVSTSLVNENGHILWGDQAGEEEDEIADFVYDRLSKDHENNPHHLVFQPDPLRLEENPQNNNFTANPCTFDIRPDDVAMQNGDFIDSENKFENQSNNTILESVQNESKSFSSLLRLPEKQFKNWDDENEKKHASKIENETNMSASQKTPCISPVNTTKACSYDALYPNNSSKSTLVDQKLREHLKKAIKSTSSYNQQINYARREERRCSFDLQTYLFHYPIGLGLENRMLIRHQSQPQRQLSGRYPVRLLAGQYQEYFAEYSPEELSKQRLKRVFTEDEQDQEEEKNVSHNANHSNDQCECQDCCDCASSCTSQSEADEDEDVDEDDDDRKTVSIKENQFSEYSNINNQYEEEDEDDELGEDEEEIKDKKENCQRETLTQLKPVRLNIITPQPTLIPTPVSTTTGSSSEISVSIVPSRPPVNVKTESQATKPSISIQPIANRSRVSVAPSTGIRIHTFQKGSIGQLGQLGQKQVRQIQIIHPARTGTMSVPLKLSTMSPTNAQGIPTVPITNQNHTLTISKQALASGSQTIFARLLQ